MMAEGVNEFKIDLAVSSGIAEAYTATIKYMEKVRETTDADIRRRQDLLNLSIMEWFWYDFLSLPRSSLPEKDSEGSKD